MWHKKYTIKSESDSKKSKSNKEKHGLDFIEVQALWDDPDLLDLSKAGRPEQEQKRVNADFPVWMIHSLDKEAKRLGVPRQSLIKVLVAEHIQQASA